jgi:hypothetical protein
MYQDFAVIFLTEIVYNAQVFSLFIYLHLPYMFRALF